MQNEFLWRPRRSCLYTPGANACALEKATILDADCLLLELEDAVSPPNKAKARLIVCDAVDARQYGKREVVNRVNGLETEWGEEDLAAVVNAGPDALLIPKVEFADDILEVSSKIDAISA